ncbi:alpha/beta fold hydrolase [Deinococcus sp. UYEF24]
MNDPMKTVLLPGTLCDAALWSGVSLPPGAQAVNTMRGASLAQAAWSVLHMASGPVHLVGFSLGALVAFEVLRQAPERVARLTLMAANPHAPSFAQLETWAEQERTVLTGRFEELAGTLAPTGPQRQKIVEMALRVGPEAFLQQLHLLRSRPDSRPTLARYTGPLNILVGEDDTVTPPSLAEEIKALAPQARLFRVPDAGHYLPLDAPQVTSAALREPAYV